MVVIQTEVEEDNILRIGFFKMLLIVWFDILLDCVGKILFFPVHLIRYVSELFFKMKKSVAITILIIVGIIIVVLGLILGVNYIMRFAQGLS